MAGNAACLQIFADHPEPARALVAKPLNGSVAQIATEIHLNESSVIAGRHEQTILSYKTRNWPAYNEALKRRGSLTIWFDPAMTWDATPTGKRGRQPVLW